MVIPSSLAPTAASHSELGLHGLKRTPLSSPVGPTMTTMAAKLTLAQLRAALKRSDRTRAFDSEAERLRGIFRSEYARRFPAVEDAFGHQLLALLKQLDAACQAADDLATAAEEAFHQHADSETRMRTEGALSGKEHVAGSGASGRRRRGNAGDHDAAVGRRPGIRPVCGLRSVPRLSHGGGMAAAVPGPAATRGRQALTRTSTGARGARPRAREVESC